ncbi:peroxisomal membrane protein PEX13 [Prorops nasuta]|uniref:peroxisomal membrane protein PEX13 n=1 Tax=Prorops nasuta TaxID=863751 RepID=UPI0034D00E38
MKIMAPERTNTFGTNYLRQSPGIMSSSPLGLQSSTAIPQTVNPPPLPPRQVQNYSTYSSYQPYSNYYGGYGGYNRGYGGYGTFSSYSPYQSSMGYGNMGYNNISPYSGDVENRFVQYAEESTRSTFHVIESVLQTFSSITMMLDSTYFALTNSFRAILSVAESVGRLRSTISQLLGTFALIRLLKWFYRKALAFLGLRSRNIQDEDLWQRSAASITNGEQTPVAGSWSGLIILSALFTIPYLINKLMNNIKNFQAKGSDPKEWFNFEEPVYTANVLYNFVPMNKDELPIKVGQKIWLAPQTLQPKNLPGWLRASDSVNVGLVPANYVNIVGQIQRKADCKNSQVPSNSSMTEQGNLTKEEPVLNEISEDTSLNGLSNTSLTS